MYSLVNATVLKDIPHFRIVCIYGTNMTLTGGKVYDKTLTRGKVYDKTLTSGKVYDKALTSGKVYDKALTSGKVYKTLTSGKVCNISH